MDGNIFSNPHEKIDHLMDFFFIYHHNMNSISVHNYVKEPQLTSMA